MASLRERLEYLITVDAKQAVKSLDQIGRTADKELGSMESKLDKASAGMTKFGVGAMAFAGVAGAALVKLGTNYMDLGVAIGEFSDATGIASETSSRFIEVADSIGVSTGSLQGAIVKMEKAVQSSPDAFNELGVSIARAADGSVDAGETFIRVADALGKIEDPAKRAELASQIFGRGFTGVAELIEMGATNVRAAMDSVGEGKLFNEEETQKARDMRASMDELTDAFQEIGLSIGGSVLPVMQSVAGVVTDVMGAFSSLPKPIKDAMGAAAGLGVGVIGATGALSFMTGQAVKTGQSIVSLVGSLGKLHPAVLIAGGAIAAAGLLYADYAKEKAEAKRITDGFVDALKQEGPAAQTAVNSFLAQELATTSANEALAEYGITSAEIANFVRGQQAPAMDALAASTEGMSGQWAALQRQLAAQGLDVGSEAEAMRVYRLVEEINKLRTGYGDAESQANEYKTTEKEVGATSEESAAHAEYYASRVAALGDEQENAKGAADRLKKTIDEQKSAFDIASEAADAFRSALDEALGGGLDYEEASQAVIEGLDAVTAAFKENGATLDINTEAGRANRDAIADQVENIAAMGEALVQQGMSAEDAATYVAGYRQQLIDQAVASGMSKEAAEAYIDQLGLTPESIQTTIKLLKAEETKAKLLEFLDGIEEIPPEKEAEIKTLIEDGKFGQAKRKLREFVDEDRSPQIKPEVDKDKNKDAKDKLKRLDEYPIEPTAKPEVDPTSKANVETELDELTEDRTVTVHVREVTDRADGGITIQNADGNFLPQDATIHNGGTLYQWGEPETGGEAFIPLSPAKRKRSLELWKRVGQYFGIMRTAADGVTAGPSSPGLAPTMPEEGTEAFKALEAAAKAAGKSVEDYFKTLVDQYDQQAEIYENMYELGKVDTESYIGWLEQKKAALVEYSDAWMSVNDQISRIQGDQADKAAEQAKTAIELAYEEAEATYAVGEARRDMRASRQEFLKALDPKSEASDQDKDAAGRSYAQSIVETLAARAANRGIEKNTVRWAKFMRRRIQRQIAKQSSRGFPAVVKWLKNELSKIPVFEDDEDLGGDESTGAPVADGAGGGNTTVPQLGSDTLVTSGASVGSASMRSGPAVYIETFNASNDVDLESFRKLMEWSVKTGTFG